MEHRGIELTLLTAGLLLLGSCERHPAALPAAAHRPAAGSAAASRPTVKLARLEHVDGHRLVPLPPPPSGLDSVQRRVLVHLAAAARAGDRIAYAQHDRGNLLIKDTLETLLLARDALRAAARPETWRHLVGYLVRFWLHHGQHDLHSGGRFAPAFDAAALRRLAVAALRARVDLPVADAAALPRAFALFRSTLFGRPGERLAADLYRGVSRERAAAFAARYRHNSRLVRRRGQLVEEVWRAGGHGTRAGVYANTLHHVIKHLRRAQRLLPLSRRARLERLIRFFATGDEKHWIAAQRLLFSDPQQLELVIGFLDTSRDPAGDKGIFGAAVGVTDPRRQRQLRAIVERARALRRDLPRALRRTPPRPPAPARALRILFAGGALAPLSPGAAIASPDTPGLVLVDLPSAAEQALAAVAPGASSTRCRPALLAAWIGLRRLLVPAVARRDEGASGDAAALLLALSPQLVASGGLPRGCGAELVRGYVRWCAAIDRGNDRPRRGARSACARVVSALLEGKAIDRRGRTASREQLRPALRAAAVRLSTTRAPLAAASRRRARALLRSIALPRLFRAHLPPPLAALPTTRRPPVDWVAHNLAWARAWRAENGRPLHRAVPKTPDGVHLDFFAGDPDRPARRPRGQLRRAKKKPADRGR